MSTLRLSFSFGLKVCSGTSKRLFDHTFLVRVNSLVRNDLELVWEWWVRKRCVNDWYIVAVSVRVGIREQGT
jgi:hypothetical protein